jgi:hypothetical protein
MSNLKSNIDNIHIKSYHVMRVYIDMINYNCDMLETYTRALRDKLYACDCDDNYDPSTTVLGPGSDIDNWVEEVIEYLQ